MPWVLYSRVDTMLVNGSNTIRLSLKYYTDSFCHMWTNSIDITHVHMHKNTQHNTHTENRHHTKAYQNLQVAQFLFITEQILEVPAIINNHKKMSQKTPDNACPKKYVNVPCIKQK